jgi:hypothetical protein
MATSDIRSIAIGSWMARDRQCSHTRELCDRLSPPLPTSVCSVGRSDRSPRCSICRARTISSSWSRGSQQRSDQAAPIQCWPFPANRAQPRSSCRRCCPVDPNTALLRAGATRPLSGFPLSMQAKLAFTAIAKVPPPGSLAVPVIGRAGCRFLRQPWWDCPFH